MKRMKEYCKICLLLLGTLTIWCPKAMAQNVKTQTEKSANAARMTEQMDVSEKVNEASDDKVLNENVGENLNDKVLNEKVGENLNNEVLNEKIGENLNNKVLNEKIGENLNDEVLNEKPVNEAVGGSSFAADRAVEPSFLGAFGGEHTDSLNLPAIGMRGEVLPMTLRPLYWGNWYNWSLHKGMNVFAEFGKNARGGAGFTQNVSAMYAVPVTKKLSVAVGGYFNNIMWQHDTWREAGVSAIMGYKFNDHWEAYLYGQKSLAGNRRFMPCTVYDISNIGDRIGAAVKYNVNPNFSFQVSVERGY